MSGGVCRVYRARDKILEFEVCWDPTVGFIESTMFRTERVLGCWGFEFVSGRPSRTCNV